LQVLSAEIKGVAAQLAALAEQLRAEMEEFKVRAQPYVFYTLPSTMEHHVCVPDFKLPCLTCLQAATIAELRGMASQIKNRVPDGMEPYLVELWNTVVDALDVEVPAPLFLKGLAQVICNHQ
jgi:hypothetical protein